MLFTLAPRRDGALLLAIAGLLLLKTLLPALLWEAQSLLGGTRWVYVCGSISNHFRAFSPEDLPGEPTETTASECTLCLLYANYDMAGDTPLPQRLMVHRAAMLAVHSDQYEPSRRAFAQYSSRAPPVNTVL